MNLIFDLDGTLVDSAGDLHAAASRMLREEGGPPLDLATIRGFIGNGVPTLVERIARASFGSVDAARQAAMERRFMAHYDAAPTALTRLYPGADRALATLAKAGHRMALCTNKPAGTSRAILRGLGIDGHFPVVIGGDSGHPRKPDPAPLRAAAEALGGSASVYVGDSEIDEAAAQAADLPFVLYTEGYRKGPAQAMRSAATFDHFDALPGTIAGLAGAV